jgi:anti-sigma regulatory factor (Ser/Thr protein kinase)
MLKSHHEFGLPGGEAEEERVVSALREVPLRLSLSPATDSAAPLRHALREALAGMCAGQEESADLVLATSEAFNNAICHGSMTADDQLWVEIEADAAELLVTFEYRGEPFPVLPATLPAPNHPCGRGRYLMELLTDQVTYEFSDHWTRTRLRKRIRGR